MVEKVAEFVIAYWKHSCYAIVPGVFYTFCIAEKMEVTRHRGH
jgi:hypothetical protein